MIGPTHHQRVSHRRSAIMIGCRVIVGMVGFAVAVADAAADDGSAIKNPIERQSLEDLSATHERPLFSPVRRPPPKIAAPVVTPQETLPPPPPAPPSVIVLGIVSDNGERRASIRSADKLAADKVTRVRAGDDVGGWKVERIEPRRLVLTLGERSADFVLFGGSEKAMKAADAAARGRQDR
jgi:general secretion pathway protein N